jgi:hypothetical protein
MAQTHSQGELEMCESARVKPPRCLTFPIWKLRVFLKSWDPRGKVWRIKSCLNKIQQKNENCIFEWHFFNCIIFIYWEVTKSIILALIYVF